MTFNLQYESDFKRIIPAVINDARNTIPAIANQPGTVIKAYADAQIDLVVPGVLLYRISTREGGLGGYVGLRVENGVATSHLMQLRPAFQPFLAEILQIIATFITSNAFLQDMIY